MAFAIKVDEDLPRSATVFLRAQGYDVLSVPEQQMSGWKDADLWKAIQSENRLLITADKGFADIRMYPPGAHAGVLLLRPAEDGIRPLLELLQSVLQVYRLENLAGLVTVVTPRGIRVRRP